MTQGRASARSYARYDWNEMVGGNLRLMRSRGGRPLILTTILLAACSTLGWQRFQDPTIELQRILVRGITLSGGSLDVEVLVRNPNGYAIRARNLELGLDVAGAHVGDIRYEKAFELPKDGTRMLTVPFDFRWAAVGSAARAAFAERQITYALAGTVRVRMALGERTFPIDRDGVVDLIRSPRSRSSD